MLYFNIFFDVVLLHFRRLFIICVCLHRIVNTCFRSDIRWLLYILNKRNHTKVLLKYSFMLKPKQLFIIIFVNVKRMYPHKAHILFRYGKISRLTGWTNDRPRNCRPRVMSQRQDRQLRLIHLRNCMITNEDTARRTPGLTNVRISGQTLTLECYEGSQRNKELLHLLMSSICFVFHKNTSYLKIKRAADSDGIQMILTYRFICQIEFHISCRDICLVIQ